MNYMQGVNSQGGTAMYKHAESNLAFGAGRNVGLWYIICTKPAVGRIARAQALNFIVSYVIDLGPRPSVDYF
jgi:hypothetical protein